MQNIENIEEERRVNKPWSKKICTNSMDQVKKDYSSAENRDIITQVLSGKTQKQNTFTCEGMV